MIDVLLTHSYHLRYDSKQLQKMQPYRPLGTLYAAAALREQGFTVALFDTMLRDPEEFAVALRRAFADEDLRRQLIEKGFANHGRFTWEMAACKTLAAYHRAAGLEATKAVYA